MRRFYWGGVLGGLIVSTACGGQGDQETSTATTSLSSGLSGSSTGGGPSNPSPSTGSSSANTSSGGEQSSSGPDEPGTSTTAAVDDSGSSSSGGAPPVGSEGCRSGQGLRGGETQFELDGVQRRYILHLPNDYQSDRPYPLLFGLHPNGGNIGYWGSTTGSRAIRPLVEDDAILVLVEDETNNWPDDLPTELAYFDHIIEQMKAELCVDEGRIFSMGFSGGGSFSGVLGCMRDDIRAIVSGGAIIYFEPNRCVGGPAAWVTIGTEELTDQRAEFRDFWRDTGECQDSTTATEPDPCVAYDGCAEQTPVQYCQHGGGHEWPNFGTEAAWAFFSQFGPAGIIEP